MGGWLAACAAATGVLCAFALVVSAVASGDVFSLRFAGGAAALLFPAVLIFIVTCLVTGIPAAVAILAEREISNTVRFVLRLRRCCDRRPLPNLLLRALLPPPSVSLLFVVAGLAAGLAYWFVAGKRAGGDLT